MKQFLSVLINAYARLAKGYALLFFVPETSEPISDTEAALRDWQAVGDDLRTAMEEFEEHIIHCSHYR